MSRLPLDQTSSGLALVATVIVTSCVIIGGSCCPTSRVATHVTSNVMNMDEAALKIVGRC